MEIAQMINLHALHLIVTLLAVQRTAVQDVMDMEYTQAVRAYVQRPLLYMTENAQTKDLMDMAYVVSTVALESPVIAKLNA
jgi:hypothetical protein